MPLKDPAARIAWKIRDIHHRHMQHVHNVISRYGLHPGQPRILHTVACMDGATQKEIAARLQVSPASLAMSIKRMQKAGLLEKVGDRRDLRINQIRLTAEGKRVQAASLAELIASAQRMLAGFSPEEIDLLASYLDRIHQNLQREEEPVHAE